MEPGSEEPGDSADRAVAAFAPFLASMEPGSEEPGDTDWTRGTTRPMNDRLQWSRAPKSPVTRKEAPPLHLGVVQLQWSRAPKSPVTS